MPGFVDVSGMTYEDVRRMGHADDYDEPSQQYKPAPSRRNPVLQVGHAVSDVWAAACAAQRVNGAYYKEAAYEWDEVTQTQKILHRKNRDVMMEFLQNPDRLLVEDVEEGERVRNFLQHDLTFRAVKGKLTEFDSAASKCLAVQDRFYTVSHRYELAVVACLPASAARTQQHQTSTSRIQFARGGFVGDVNSKVQANVEVLSCVHSKQFNIFWIRALTDADQPVFFSSKTPYDVGTNLTITGKVKAHKDNFTQLNYVKVL